MPELAVFAWATLRVLAAFPHASRWTIVTGTDSFLVLVDGGIQHFRVEPRWSLHNMLCPTAGPPPNAEIQNWLCCDDGAFDVIPKRCQQDGELMPGMRVVVQAPNVRNGDPVGGYVEEFVSEAVARVRICVHGQRIDPRAACFPQCLTEVPAEGDYCFAEVKYIKAHIFSGENAVQPGDSVVVYRGPYQGYAGDVLAARRGRCDVRCAGHPITIPLANVHRWFVDGQIVRVLAGRFAGIVGVVRVPLTAEKGPISSPQATGGGGVLTLTPQRGTSRDATVIVLAQDVRVDVHPALEATTLVPNPLWMFHAQLVHRRLDVVVRRISVGRSSQNCTAAIGKTGFVELPYPLTPHNCNAAVDVYLDANRSVSGSRRAGLILYERTMRG